MAKLLKLRRGTTSQHNTFTGAEGELTIDTTKDTAVVNDGTTAGGHPLAKEDMSNVSSSAIAGRLGADAIAVTKIAAGTLPSDVKVTDSNVSGNLTIVNADVTSSAAIAGTKISPNFGSQNVETTGHIDIPDNSKLKIGTGDDLTLYHNGTNSFIENSTGSLYIRDTSGGDVRIQGKSGEDSIICHDDDGVHIYYDNNVKLTTENHGISVTGNINVSGTVDGRDVASDGSKLDGIESGATGDQTAAEILTAIKTVDGSGSGLDADTLDGMNASASASNSTIVARNSSGYVFANFFNTSPDDRSSGLTKICCETGNDGYIRHATAAGVRSFINVENGATGDQTAAEIRTLVESASDSNVFTDADHSKLNGIAASATNVTNNNQITNGRGFTTYTSNQATNTNSNVTFGTINCSSLTASGNVTAYSDSRLKTDISTINDALGTVGKLRGVSYKWLRSGQSDIGVIAQEVEAVVPEVVKTTEVAGLDGMEEVKSVDYGRLVGVLINAINELKAEVDELKGGK